MTVHADELANVNAADDPGQAWKKRAALAAVGAAFGGTVLLISPFVLTQLRSPLPYMSTPGRKVSKALEEIARRRGLSATAGGGDAASSGRRLRFTDLGSGDGSAVLAAASSPRWTAAGIELNSTLFLLSSVRRLFGPSHVRRNSRFVWGDMWKSDLRREDAVMIFGVKPLMPRVAEKIGRECAAGTYVMSYRFRVPLADEVEEGVVQAEGGEGGAGDEEGGGRLRARIVYDEEEMRVYEVMGDKGEEKDEDAAAE